MTVPYGSTMRSTSRRADRTDNDLSIRVVDAVVLTSSECLALAVTFERMLQRDPTLAGVLDPATHDDLPRHQRRRPRRTSATARERLAGDVPIRVAAERLDVSERTVRRWAATGRVAAVRAERGWLVDREYQRDGRGVTLNPRRSCPS